MKIRSIGAVPYEGKVHNLSVDGDESFTVEGVAAHNCRCRKVSLSAFDLARRGLTVTDGGALSGLPDRGWNAAVLAERGGVATLTLADRILFELQGMTDPEDQLAEGFVRTIAGINILVNRPRGFVQVKRDETGAELWRRTYKVDYGEILRDGTKGGDGEALDVFIGTSPRSPKAFWIVQVDDAGDFDELKLMLGFDTENDAVDCYAAHVPIRHFRAVYQQPVGMIGALLGVHPKERHLGLERSEHGTAPLLLKWQEGAHPRGSDGRFGKGGAPATATEASKAIAHLGQTLKATGGFTWSPKGGTPKTGFMCSTDPSMGHGHVIELTGGKGDGAKVRETMKAWVAQHLPFVKANPEHYFGGWLDKSGGKPTLYLDISQRFHDKGAAIEAGKKRNQVAVFHLDSFSTIDTGGTGR